MQFNHNRIFKYDFPDVLLFILFADTQHYAKPCLLNFCTQATMYVQQVQISDKVTKEEEAGSKKN